MSLYEQFVNYTNQNGINMDDVYYEKGEDYEIVSFGENAPSDGNLIYNISLVFYDKDDMVEMYIRKPIKDDNPLEIYKTINDINFKIRGVTFIYFTGMLCLKCYCLVGNDINVAIQILANNMKVSQSVFREFESA